MMGCPVVPRGGAPHGLSRLCEPGRPTCCRLGRRQVGLRLVLGGQGHGEDLPAGQHITRGSADWALPPSAEGWAAPLPAAQLGGSLGSVAQGSQGRARGVAGPSWGGCFYLRGLVHGQDFVLRETETKDSR